MGELMPSWMNACVHVYLDMDIIVVPIKSLFKKALFNMTGEVPTVLSYLQYPVSHSRPSVSGRNSAGVDLKQEGTCQVSSAAHLPSRGGR